MRRWLLAHLPQELLDNEMPWTGQQSITVDITLITHKLTPRGSNHPSVVALSQTLTLTSTGIQAVQSWSLDCTEAAMDVVSSKAFSQADKTSEPKTRTDTPASSGRGLLTLSGVWPWLTLRKPGGCWVCSFSLRKVKTWQNIHIQVFCGSLHVH